MVGRFDRRTALLGRLQAPDGPEGPTYAALNARAGQFSLDTPKYETSQPGWGRPAGLFAIKCIWDFGLDWWDGREIVLAVRLIPESEFEDPE
jgi:hypothetical protein